MRFLLAYVNVTCCTIWMLILREIPVEAFPIQASSFRNRSNERQTENVMMRNFASISKSEETNSMLSSNDISGGLTIMTNGLSRRSTIGTLWKTTLVALTGVAVVNIPVASASAVSTTAPNRFEGFQRISTQFIAALGDPKSSSGNNAASDWGVWTVDPGPRGVRLEDSKTLERTQLGPYGWTFNSKDWWLEEHGLIMETPDFSLPTPGKYVVTGGRETTSILTVLDDGSWSLDGGATLADVTHLPCRAARYTPPKGTSANICTPSKANPSNFPVRPGALMPKVNGCDKQDYAVIFVIGKAKEDTAAEKLLAVEL